MFSCRVLVGPIATDKEYQTGDTVCLDKKDADTLASFGLIEIIGEVQAKFVPTVAKPVVEVAAPIAAPVEAVPAPAIETVIPVVEVPAPVETPAPTPVVEATTPIEPAPAIVDEATTLNGEDAIGLEKLSTTKKK